MHLISCKPHSPLLTSSSYIHIHYPTHQTPSLLSLSPSNISGLLFLSGRKMGRKCSRCGNIGHNSRTCTSFMGAASACGLKLFGVHLDLSLPSSSPSPSPSSSSSSSSSSASCSCAHPYLLAIRKSLSMDCLSSSSASSSSSSPSSSLSLPRVLADKRCDKTSLGYLSDGLAAGSQEKRKGASLEPQLFLEVLMIHIGYFLGKKNVFIDQK